jgi:Ca-activated chloride channel family protein
MLEFTTPNALLFLLLVPLTCWMSAKYDAIPVMRLSTNAPAASAPASTALKIRWFVPALKYTALVLMIVALARPQWPLREATVMTDGINIVVAIDLSESMAALDFKKDGQTINRLTAVKGVVKKFVGGRKGDRIGLVVFGSEAYTQLPLTRDYHVLSTVTDKLDIGAAGKRTAVGDAIGIALKRLTDVKAAANVIILLTDGRSNAGAIAPNEAAAIAAEKKVRVYTVGVGTHGKAPFLIEHPLLGSRTVYQAVDLDEATLQKIADKTGGRYFRADSTETLTAISDAIDKLEKTPAHVKTYTEYRELYGWPLGAALGCLALFIVLGNTRFLEIP